ncbi:hypothetical protein RBU55_15520 [Pseudomonas chlororaphis subsp. aurantiaca]|uniref:hypothetical protein n=1 Tax=Pseudomonas chlororaphis TaxID=587753 RepID=UPI0027DDA8E8|nr:hypothetical protein [Pseudomonas chlororaphis]WMJ02920.1 hypothetical protein RBU55_15520 [Pseudomonas chlororaphis subsp. aurantiaca]
MSEMKSESKGDSESEQHIDGVYGGWELLIAGVVLVFVALLDVVYLQLYLFDHEPVYVFSAVMISALGGFILWLPFARRWIEAAGETWFSNFLALPDYEVPITFPVVSGFLGEQALGGFLGSVLMLTTHEIFSNFGATIAGIYCFTVIVLAITITSFSLLRFVVLFARYGWPTYGAASISSLIVMFGFFWAGVTSVS